MGKKRLLVIITFLALLSVSAVAGITIVGYAEEYVYTNPGCVPFCFGNNKTYDLGGKFQIFEATKVGGHYDHEAEWFDGGLALFADNAQTGIWSFFGAANSALQTYYHNFEGVYADRIAACGCSYDYHQGTHPFSIEYNRNVIVRRTNVYDDPILLGEVGSFFGKFSSLTNDSGWRIRVGTLVPGSMIWLGDEESYTTKETNNETTEVYACADTNRNNICDVNEASFRSCDSAGGDWYKGYCCGVNFTSCQSVGKIQNGTYDVCTEYRTGPWGSRTCVKKHTVIDNATINAICGKNIEGDWEWVPAEEAGEIHEMSCPNGSTVANGSAIFNCGDPMEGVTLPFGDFRTVKLGSLSHEYTCKDKTVYECSGASGSFSSINAMAVGTTNPSFTNQTYYCASDGDWTTDLDVKDKDSCELAGFSWTGSMCCSEADDPHEYYNDPAFPKAEGGCWDKTFIRNGEFSIGSRIINYRGKFYGCRVREDSLVLLTDSHSGERLIDNSVLPCGQVLMDVKPGGLPHAVCQPDGQNGKWIFTDEPGGTINKSIKWLPSSMKGISQTGCCAYDQCWNGTRCQQLDAFYRVADQGYICKIGPQPQAPVVCDLSSDCPQGLMCQGNYCVPLPAGSCVHDNDCGQNLDCVSNVCVPSHCSNNNPCPSGFNCANNNKCTIAV
jgi:hypothetical protein